MNETYISWLTIVRFLPVVAFATCYSLGGRSEKFIRRIIAPSLFFFGLLILGAFLGTFNLFFLAPCMALSFAVSFGYGSDSIIGKLWKRLLFGLAVGLCGLMAGLIADETVLGIAQMLFSVLASVMLGMFNPIKAPQEEALIATLSTILIPFML